MLPVSLSFAAALALFNLWLGYRVSRLRIAGKVLIGDGGDPLLQARMRAQANFVEYSPFVLVLLALIEQAGGPPAWLRAIAAAYLLARIAHAFGMDRRSTNPLRAGGILVTWAIVLGLAVWAIVIASTAAGSAGAIRLR